MASASVKLGVYLLLELAKHQRIVGFQLLRHKVAVLMPARPGDTMTARRGIMNGGAVWE
jgi:hypothetical protein